MLDTLISLFNLLPSDPIVKGLVIYFIFVFLSLKFVILPLVEKEEHEKEVKDKLDKI